MAKIIDPDNINFAVNATATTEEFELQTGAKTIKANISSTNLDDDSPGKTSGATGRALYSALKIEWLANTTLRKYKFPIKMIFEGSFIVTNAWAFLDKQTRDVMRDAGFNEQLTSDDWACMISLGSIDAPLADQVYYVQATGFTATTTDYDKTGELNENIDITASKTYQKSFLREQGKIFAEYALLVEQGISTLNFQAYSFPLSNGTDLKISASDATIGGANDPYQNMTIDYLKGSKFTTWTDATTYIVGDVVLDAILQASGSSNGTWWFCSATTGDSSGTGTADDTGNTWESYDGEEQIGVEWYAFNRVVNCATGTNIEAYEYMQYQLRQAGDINADGNTTPSQGAFGTVNGAVAELLGEFIGDNLKPKPGVVLRNFDTNSTNAIQHSPISVDTGGLDSNFVPLSSVEVPFPFVAAGNLNFSANYDAQLDSETVYDMYFEYITRTAATALTMSSATLQNADVAWTGGELDHLIVGDFIVMTGWTTPSNDGEYEVITTNGTTTMNVDILNSSTTLVDEGPLAIQVDENPFGSLGATIVNDNSGTPITGEITATTIGWDFDYTNNNQEGRTAGTDAAIHVIAIALDGSEWGDATHTITAAVGQNIAINGNDERNFSNPA